VTDARYHRHNLIDWFSQDALAKTKVAVIGAGAVGNEVIKNLALLGVGEIYVFDLDVIEEHNLTRSVLFRDADIGQPKAAVAAKRAMELDAF
jgi:molybdopterin/thiamine biosynthesis adenylyltransferase